MQNERAFGLGFEGGQGGRDARVLRFDGLQAEDEGVPPDEDDARGREEGEVFLQVEGYVDRGGAHPGAEDDGGGGPGEGAGGVDVGYRGEFGHEGEGAGGFVAGLRGGHGGGGGGVGGFVVYAVTGVGCQCEAAAKVRTEVLSWSAFSGLGWIEIQ